MIEFRRDDRNVNSSVKRSEGVIGRGERMMLERLGEVWGGWGADCELCIDLHVSSCSMFVLLHCARTASHRLDKSAPGFLTHIHRPTDTHVDARTTNTQTQSHMRRTCEKTHKIGK